METYNSSSAAAGIFSGIFGLFSLAVLVLTFVSMWKIFTKAGKPGWAAIVPIYNLIVLMEIIGKPTWWVVLFFLPCVNIVAMVWSFNLLSKSFGQSEGFTVGLLLLSVVFFPLLAFGNYTYLGPAGNPLANNPFNNTSFNDNNFRDPFSNNNPPKV